MSFDLEVYLAQGVTELLRDILKTVLKNPRESMFLAQYAIASKKAARIRKAHARRGQHVPSFLIASITSQCNLACAGCYDRANRTCRNEQILLSASEWGEVFEQADKLGIGFILLAGGEPMLREDVIQEAARHEHIIFPIFTNGTMLDADYRSMLNAHRNLIPIFSIEGDRIQTDGRRGSGIYQTLMTSMDDLQTHEILFGASVTVTKENLYVVTSDDFLNTLRIKGCKLVFYIEYVPVDHATQSLAPDDADRMYLSNCLDALREHTGDMVYISFPGDEKASGGCLAAGRGFFHINASGGAEPCPFSPYSDTNLREVSLLEAMNSPLFRKLRDSELLMQEHIGGCVLFEREDTVQQLLSGEE